MRIRIRKTSGGHRGGSVARIEPVTSRAPPHLQVKFALARAMFGLLSGLYQYTFTKTELNILILGLDHAGKTTLLEQMKGIYKKMPGIPPDRIPPTIGLNIGKMDINQCQCMFWDLGGQQRMRGIWEKYYADGMFTVLSFSLSLTPLRTAHAMIFVIDSADAGRMDEALLAFEAVRSHEELHGVPVLLMANKQDLPGALSPADIERKFSWTGSSSQTFRVQPASCLTCEGIADGVGWVIDEARSISRGFE